MGHRKELVFVCVVFQFCGRLNEAPLNVCVPFQSLCDYVSLHSKRDAVAVSKWRILTWGDHLGGPNVITKVLIRVGQEDQSQRR